MSGHGSGAFSRGVFVKSCVCAVRLRSSSERIKSSKTLGQFLSVTGEVADYVGNIHYQGQTVEKHQRSQPVVKSGDTVLDLGSGGGKLCYIAAQLVGPEGRIIGVDCNQETLGLARRYQAQVAERIGFDNVSFRCGMIQDLQLDLELLAKESSGRQRTGVQGILEQRLLKQRLRTDRPLIARLEIPQESFPSPLTV